MDTVDIQKLVVELKGKGLSQAGIAAAIPCSQPTISDIENGRIGKSRPSFKIVDGLMRLARQHGVDMRHDSDRRSGSDRRKTPRGEAV